MITNTIIAVKVDIASTPYLPKKKLIGNAITCSSGRDSAPTDALDKARKIISATVHATVYMACKLNCCEKS
jgi:hypothetical protein